MPRQKSRHKVDQERFTLFIPTEWRKIAEQHCDNDIGSFNYAKVIREAMKDYYLTKRWVE